MSNEPSTNGHFYLCHQAAVIFILGCSPVSCSWLFSCLDNEWVEFSGQWIAHWKKTRTSVKEMKNRKWTKMLFSSSLFFSLLVLFKGSTANRGKSAWEEGWWASTFQSCQHYHCIELILPLLILGSPLEGGFGGDKMTDERRGGGEGAQMVQLWLLKASCGMHYVPPDWWHNQKHSFEVVRSKLDSIAASLFVLNWLSWQIVRRLPQPPQEGVQDLWGASAHWKLEVADVFWWISPPVYM